MRPEGSQTPGDRGRRPVRVVDVGHGDLVVRDEHPRASARELVTKRPSPCAIREHEQVGTRGARGEESFHPLRPDARRVRIGQTRHHRSMNRPPALWASEQVWAGASVFGPVGPGAGRGAADLHHDLEPVAGADHRHAARTASRRAG